MIRSRPIRHAPASDPVSICLAGACAVHCLVTPLAVGLLPVVGITLANPGLEWIFLTVSLATSMFTLLTGCLRSHRQWRALAPFVAGAACLVGTRGLTDPEGSLAHIGVTAGATLVITAHAFNIRLCRRAGAARCGRLERPAESRLLQV
jgi:hypothetical protein